MEAKEAGFGLLLWTALECGGLFSVQEGPCGNGFSDLEVKIGDDLYLLEFKRGMSAREGTRCAIRRNYIQSKLGQYRNLYFISINFNSKQRNINYIKYDKKYDKKEMMDCEIYKFVKGEKGVMTWVGMPERVIHLNARKKTIPTLFSDFKTNITLKRRKSLEIETMKCWVRDVLTVDTNRGGDGPGFVNMEDNIKDCGFVNHLTPRNLKNGVS